MIKKTRLFFFFLLLNSFCFSQNQVLDSLLNLLKQDKLDTNKVIHYNKIAYEYKNIGSFDNTLKYTNLALKLSEDLLYKNKNEQTKKTLLKGKAVSLHTLGALNEIKGNTSQALQYYSECLKLLLSIGNKKSAAYAYNNIALVYYNTGNHPEALKNHLAALKIRETIGDKQGLADTYNNIALVYLNQKNYTEALKNVMLCLKICKEIDYKYGISSSYASIGGIYDAQGNYAEALKNHLISLQIETELNNKYGIARTYNNIGIVYENLQNYEEALKNYIACLKIETEIDDKPGLTATLNNMGSVYTKQKKYAEAEKQLKKAKELAEELGHKEYLKDTYRALTKLDSSKGNFKSAFENHKLYIVFRDSIDNEDTRKKTIQSAMTYDFEKKEAATKAEQEKKDAIAEEEKQKQKLITYAVSLGLVLVAFLALFVYRGFRQKQKANVIITNQKLEVEKQKHLVEEHQKEIIDSITYAKRIQKAILPSNEEIKKYLPNSFVLYKPKDIVAGDFYWMENINEITFIAAADSTGHGVPGAMVSVVCSNALNRAVNEFKMLKTGEILDKTRNLVLETFAKSGEEIKDGMDISLISIDKKARKINWSGANNSLLYISNNELNEVKADKQPIGKTDTPKPFITHEINFNNGDIFYLITDGFADQFGGEKGKKFKTANMKNLFVELQQLELEEQKEKINSAFENWRGDLEQVDDVCIIGIKI
ncbi:MAG: tetratricopeptide repeat protein [Bacteroidota bacterium]